MRIVALAWQVFSITGSSVAVGMLGLTEVIPLLVLSAYSGAIADTHDRKRIMFWAQAGSVVVSIALAALTLADAAPVAILYLLSAAAASCDALDGPARMAIVPSLVGWDKIGPAYALRQIIYQVTQIAGPAIGGLLIGASSVGAVYVIDAATFMISIGLLVGVPSRPPAGITHGSRFQAVKEGLRWALGRPLLRSIFLIDFAAMVFGLPRALFPELAVEVFHIGASGVGLLYAAPAVGALAGAVLSGWVTRVPKQGLAIFGAVAVWGASITLTGLVIPNLGATLFFLVIAGGADVLSAVFRGTLLQQSTPDHLRGRVTSVNTLATVGGPRLGDVEAGVAAALLGLRNSIVFGGLVSLAVTALIALRYPVLRRFRRAAPPVAGRVDEIEPGDVGPDL